MGTRAKMSRQHSERWAVASHEQYAEIAERETLDVLAETEPEPDGHITDRWSLEAFTPGCFRYAFPGAAAMGEEYILEAPAALAESLAAFVQS